MLLLSAPGCLLLPAHASHVRRLFSFGGGVQSTAVLVLQATGKLDRRYDEFVFSNVGEDSENPDTLAYIENYTRPYAEEHGIRLITVQKHHEGNPETLYQYCHRIKRGIPLPMRMAGNGAPGHRSCTQNFKIEVIERYAKQNGITDLISGIGISLDEFHRMRDCNWTDLTKSFRVKREYPLIDMRIDRARCKQIITRVGLPVSPKSSCFFCPFHKRSEWIEMKRNRPDLFERAVNLERMLNEKRGLLDRDACYLHRSLVPLDQAVGDQLPMFADWDMDTCESGYCMV